MNILQCKIHNSPVLHRLQSVSKAVKNVKYSTWKSAIARSTIQPTSKPKCLMSCHINTTFNVIFETKTLKVFSSYPSLFRINRDWFDIVKQPHLSNRQRRARAFELLNAKERDKFHGLIIYLSIFYFTNAFEVRTVRLQKKVNWPSLNISIGSQLARRTKHGI